MKNTAKHNSTKGRDLKVGDEISTFFCGSVQTSTIVSIREVTSRKRTLTLSDGALWTVYAGQTYRTVAK